MTWYSFAVLTIVDAPTGLRYLRWGGDGEAVQPEKSQGVENCLREAWRRSGK